MKYRILFFNVSFLCGVFFSSSTDTPETRQSTTSALLILDSNSFSSNIFSQINRIKFTLKSNVGQFAHDTVVDGMKVIVTTLNQANQFYNKLVPSIATEMSVKIASLSVLQGQINTELTNCVNNYQYLSVSCGKTSLFTLISQFFYEAGSLLMEMIVGFSSDCTVVVPTTTTPSTITTTESPTCENTPEYVHYHDILYDIEMNELAPARTAINSQYWKTNLPTLPIEITKYYDLFVRSLNYTTGIGNSLYINMENTTFNTDRHLGIYRPFSTLDTAALTAELYAKVMNETFSKEFNTEHLNIAFGPAYDVFYEAWLCKNDTLSLKESCGCSMYQDIINPIRMYAKLFNKFFVWWSDACPKNITSCTEAGNVPYTLFGNVVWM